MPEIPGSANAEWRKPAPSRKSLAVPELGGEDAPDARNPWQCQCWMAKARSKPENPGSASLQWRGPAPRQKSLALPALSGENPHPRPSWARSAALPAELARVSRATRGAPPLCLRCNWSWGPAYRHRTFPCSQLRMQGTSSRRFRHLRRPPRRLLEPQPLRRHLLLPCLQSPRPEPAGRRIAAPRRFQRPRVRRGRHRSCRPWRLPFPCP